MLAAPFTVLCIRCPSIVSVKNPSVLNIMSPSVVDIKSPSHSFEGLLTYDGHIMFKTVRGADNINY
jgi:hypothetical protein